MFWNNLQAEKKSFSEFSAPLWVAAGTQQPCQLLAAVSIVIPGIRVLGLNAKTANRVPSLGHLSSSHLDSAPTLQAPGWPRVICFHSIVNIRLSFNRPYPFFVSSLLPLWAGSLNPIIYEQITGLLFQRLGQTIVHNIHADSIELEDNHGSL